MSWLWISIIVLEFTSSILMKESKDEHLDDHDNDATLPGQGKVIGGTPARLGDFPSMVSLRYNYEHICGGTLIDTENVLTAAHCFEDAKEITSADAHFYSIMCGDIHRKKSHDSAPTRQEVVAQEIFVHKDYNPHTLFTDIAIIRLEKPVATSANVKPAQLVVTIPPEETHCVVIGFGVTSNDEENAKRSDWLLETDVYLHNMLKCTDTKLGKVDPVTMICAGNEDEEKDSCQGDSGGPLVCDKIIVGIVSYGDECGVDDLPAIYTNVSYFTDWIRTIQHTKVKRNSEHLVTVKNGANYTCQYVPKLSTYFILYVLYNFIVR